jgi:hypothetical protein
MSTIDMEEAHSCDIRVHAYKNGKTMEQCREEARKNTETLSHEILKNRDHLTSFLYMDMTKSVQE